MVEVKIDGFKIIFCISDLLPALKGGEEVRITPTRDKVEILAEELKNQRE